MNAALFMLTSACMAGADPAPATDAKDAPAPAVVSTGSACPDGGCAKGCNSCCGKPSFFAKLHKIMFEKPPEPEKKDEPAKEEPAKCATCSSCGHTGLFSKMRFSKHGSTSTCSTCDSGCAPAAAAPTPEAIPAKDAPKKEMPKDLPPSKEGKGGVTNLRVAPIVTPLSIPKPVVEVSGPGSPF